ncbi:MAG: uracil-DNA glycosylase [Candidatus Sedimenticola sp. 6PFRAG5]
MDRARRQQYLDAMGIQGWATRGAASEDTLRQEEIARDVEDATLRGADSRAVDPAPAPESPPASSPASSPAIAADATDMPSWMDDLPPLTDDFAPVEDVDSLPADMAPAQPQRSDVERLDWPHLEQRVGECEACELHTSRTNTVFGVGNREADLLVIGEAPGADEDRQGEPFVGRAGQLLNAMLRAIGLQRDDVYIANILKCRPPGNRDPRHEEAAACEPYLRRQVALLRPKAILCVGRVAAHNLLKTEEAVGRMRGKDYRYDQIPVVVTYHPAYLLRSPDQKAKAWQDLQAAVTRLKAV